jgi:hypothetical protein
VFFSSDLPKVAVNSARTVFCRETRAYTIVMINVVDLGAPCNSKVDGSVSLLVYGICRNKLLLIVPACLLLARLKVEEEGFFRLHFSLAIEVSLTTQHGQVSPVFRFFCVDLWRATHCKST